MTTAVKTILLIEDDVALNRLLCDQLKRLGYEAKGARSLGEADQALKTNEPAVVLLDMRLPDTEGFEAVDRFKDVCPVIILTAYGSVDQAVEAVRSGATDYLVKPVSIGRLDIAISRALRAEQMRRKLEIFESQNKSATKPRMIGTSPAFHQVQQMISLVANGDTTVLIQGESGVGKELVAEQLHLQSPRNDHQLVTIDCATLHENLLESELFGHERGAFTGADHKKEGLLEVADGGTVFLDEVGEISPTIQAKLLRVLETSRFRRLGGTRDITVNVRFITATNRNLNAWAKDGNFRADLYYRLSPFTISVPSLRERRDDILPIAQHFLNSRNFNRNVEKRFHATTEKLLADYDWPGNVRELRNAVERGIIMAGSSTVILPRHMVLPTHAPNAGQFNLSFDHEPTLNELSEAYENRMLDIHGQNRAKAARAMGVSVRTLYRKAAKTGAAKETEET